MSFCPCCCNLHKIWLSLFDTLSLSKLSEIFIKSRNELGYLPKKMFKWEGQSFWVNIFLSSTTSFLMFPCRGRDGRADKSRLYSVVSISFPTDENTIALQQMQMQRWNTASKLSVSTSPTAESSPLSRMIETVFSRWSTHFSNTTSNRLWQYVRIALFKGTPNPRRHPESWPNIF